MLTYWDFGWFTLYEPVTVLTDLVVTAVCWRAAWLLQRQSGPTSVLKRLFIGYFVLMGLATAYGGIIGHGFIVQLGHVFKTPGWYISMLAVALLERAAIYHAGPKLPAAASRLFRWMNLAELACLCVVVWVTQNFFFVELHAVYGLLVIVGGLEAWLWFRFGSRGSKQLLLGIGWAALAALVHLQQWAPHRWFNHLDVSHLLMATSAWWMYLGARAILEAGQTAEAG